MPLSALMRMIEPAGIASTEIEINSDILSDLGIKRGSTIEYIPFQERFKKRFYLIYIRPIKTHAIANICLDCNQGNWRVGNDEYELTDIEILGVIIEKPRLRLIR